MSSKILKNIPELYAGVFDSCVETDNEKPVILQLTDMQIIDSSQVRYPERLNPVEAARWVPENVDVNCLDQIRHIVAETKPDMIVITGDLVYGEFDDSGRINKLFYEFMDSFNIPWAPCFGNHDNETKIGVERQCDMLEALPNCLFKRGNVAGYGNYTVGLLCNNKLFRAVYMLDSHGCLMGPQLTGNQLALVETCAGKAEKLAGKAIPGILGYHIPDTNFRDVATEKGYFMGGFGYIGKDFPEKDGDFGGKFEHYAAFQAPDGYRDYLKRCNIDGVLTGHCHIINAVVLCDGIQYVFGTKTGTYDYHHNDMLGGTVIDTATSPLTVKHFFYPTDL